jgi:hypothetical protein
MIRTCYFRFIRRSSQPIELLLGTQLEHFRHKTYKKFKKIKKKKKLFGINKGLYFKNNQLFDLLFGFDFFIL